jgi:2-dehydro-3-deoxyphosphogluconate aldolase/(4S)-4-hydroxy-2-oxoglutarate aldolase
MAITETHVVQQLDRARVVALAAPDTPALAEQVGAALVRGGITALELAGPDATLIRAARRDERLLVGAGNLRTAAEAELAQRAGAHFASSPVTNTEVIWACRELELPFFPGAATPTEVERLALLGVTTIRVFPAMPLGGAAFLQALASVCPEVRLFPSGGVGPEALRPLLAVPAVAAVGTSGIIGTELVRSRSFDRIEWMAREASRAITRSSR